MDRREFLEKLLQIGVASSMPLELIAADTKRKAQLNSQIGFCLIGCGYHALKMFVPILAKHSECKLLYICDPDPRNAAKVKKLAESLGIKGVQYEKDFRKVVDRKELDAVIVATPHHWHCLAAITAMQAGKDVYLEKPGTHVMRETKLLLDTIQKTKRICQLGTQNRSNDSLRALQLMMRAKQFGAVNRAHCLSYLNRPRKVLAAKKSDTKSFDYNLWLGPANTLENFPQKLQWNWHFFWQTGNGGIGNWGIHRLDIARYALELEAHAKRSLSVGARYSIDSQDIAETPNLHLSVHEYENLHLIQECREYASAKKLGLHNGVLFYTDDFIISYINLYRSTLFDKKGKRIKLIGPKKVRYAEYDHFHNFIQAIKNRNPGFLRAPAEDVLASSELCHIANVGHRIAKKANRKTISQSLQKSLDPENAEDIVDRLYQHKGQHKLEGDLSLSPWLKTESLGSNFIDNSEAQKYWSKKHRKGFEL